MVRKNRGLLFLFLFLFASCLGNLVTFPEIEKRSCKENNDCELVWFCKNSYCKKELTKVCSENFCRGLYQTECKTNEDCPAIEKYKEETPTQKTTVQRYCQQGQCLEKE